MDNNNNNNDFPNFGRIVVGRNLNNRPLNLDNPQRRMNEAQERANRMAALGEHAKRVYKENREGEAKGNQR